MQQTDLFEIGEPEPNSNPLDDLVKHIPGMFPDVDLDEMWSACDLRQYEYQIMGGRGQKPRLERFYADTPTPLQYTFAGTRVVSTPLPQWLRTISHTAGVLADVHFNSCFVNAYRDGNDSILWHDDRGKKGKGIVIGDTIASVTFCEPSGVRPFQLRPYQKDEHGYQPVTSYNLCDGDVLIMRAGTQEKYQHRVPKSPKSQRDSMGRRLNLTFRHSTAMRR